MFLNKDNELLENSDTIYRVVALSVITLERCAWISKSHLKSKSFVPLNLWISNKTHLEIFDVTEMNTHTNE
jgi:hypothetical protein